MNDPQGTKLIRKKQAGRRPSKPASPLRAVFGLNLRLVRIKQDLSIYEAAARAEVDWSYFAQIERGERSVGLDVMDAIAAVVGVPLHELLNPEANFGVPDQIPTKAERS